MYCLHKGPSVQTKHSTHFLHNGNKNSTTYIFELLCFAVFKTHQPMPLSPDDPSRISLKTPSTPSYFSKYQNQPIFSCRPCCLPIYTESIEIRFCHLYRYTDSLKNTKPASFTFQSVLFVIFFFGYHHAEPSRFCAQLLSHSNRRLIWQTQ